MPVNDTQSRIGRGPLRQGKHEASGGRNATVSLFELRPSADRVSLDAPYLLYCGVVNSRIAVYDDGELVRFIEAGESLVVPPLQSLSAGGAEVDDGPTRCVVLRVDSKSVQSVLDRVSEGPSAGPSEEAERNEQPFCSLDRKDGIHRLMRMIELLLRRSPPNRDLLLDLNVEQLIIFLLQSPARPLLLNGFSRQTAEGGIAAAVQYIQEHLNRHISIDELVEEACMSKSSFYRHFGDEFNMSPLEYITRQRIARAREKLSDPKTTVTSVCHALGFSSTSYFIDMFKEYEGVTPKQYQLQVTAGAEHS